MAGIEHALKSVEAAKVLVVDAVKLAKDGISFADLPGVFKVLSDIKDLVDHAPAALPELKDLDPVESGQLMEASYQAVKDIIAALK